MYIYMYVYIYTCMYTSYNYNTTKVCFFAKMPFQRRLFGRFLKTEIRLYMYIYKSFFNSL